MLDLVKSEEDYPALIYLMEHKTYIPIIEECERLIERLNQNSIFCEQLPLELFIVAGIYFRGYNGYRHIFL